MSHLELEKTLGNLHRTGSLVKDRGYRQVWRFEHAGHAYFLKFYPRKYQRLKRLLRRNPAMREFVRLGWLQKASVPAPRGIAVLMGFRLDQQLGDAVILSAIEPGIALDQYLNELHLSGESIPDHLELARQMGTLIHNLGLAKLGHGDLHLGNFLLKEKKLYLLDAYAVRKGGMRRKDVMQLAHSLRPYATRSDLQRGWELLGPGGPLPRFNPVSRKWWRKLLSLITGENRYFGILRSRGWRGHFFKSHKYPRRWSCLSRLTFTEQQWQRAWPQLLDQIRCDEFTIIKRTGSGDVLSGQIVLRGRPIPVVIKRPRRKYWWRHINEIFRGSRARRAWGKAWSLIARNIPTAWPILLMEKRVLGYVTDALVVFERIEGATLAKVDLDRMPGPRRDMLFRRAGRLLRLLEEDGLYHYDAKSSNWVVLDDAKLGPTPVLVDVDGIRRIPWQTVGIDRLLRSMRDHTQYTPADSLALCQGYAPRGKLIQPVQLVKELPQEA